jgi:hypothetical protein
MPDACCTRCFRSCCPRFPPMSFGLPYLLVTRALKLGLCLSAVECYQGDRCASLLSTWRNIVSAKADGHCSLHRVPFPSVSLNRMVTRGHLFPGHYRWRILNEPRPRQAKLPGFTLTPLLVSSVHSRWSNNLSLILIDHHHSLFSSTCLLEPPVAA